MKRSQGFTLIELIMVITILGILSAVALPRFTGMQRDARIAKLQAARGAVQSAAAMIFGAAQARAGAVQPNCVNVGAGANPPNVNALGAGTICTASGRVSVVNWNPTADLNGIISAAGLTSAFPATAAGLAAERYAVTGGGAAANSVITVQVLGGPNPATCSFTYSPSAGGVAGTAATIAVMNEAGC